MSEMKVKPQMVYVKIKFMLYSNKETFIGHIDVDEKSYMFINVKSINDIYHKIDDLFIIPKKYDCYIIKSHEICVTNDEYNVDGIIDVNGGLIKDE